MTRAEGYLLEEVSERSGVEVRTLHYWMSRGLLKGAGRQGPGTRYPEGFLHRVMFIQKLRERLVPLELIAETLDSLPEELIERIAEGKEEVRVVPLSALGVPAATWHASPLVVRERSGVDLRSPVGWDTAASPAGPWEEMQEIAGAFRSLVSGARRRTRGKGDSWATGQVGEDVLILVRGLDARGEEELKALARRVEALVFPRPGRKRK